jgi:hypothetical protein
MEGKFLSGEVAGQRDAFVLRKAVFDGRDQSQFLPDADGIGVAGLGGKRAEGIPFCAKSESEDYAHREIAQL